MQQRVVAYVTNKIKHKTISSRSQRGVDTIDIATADKVRPQMKVALSRQLSRVPSSTRTHKLLFIFVFELTI